MTSVSAPAICIPATGDTLVVEFAKQELRCFLDRTPPLAGLEEVRFEVVGGELDRFAFESSGAGWLRIIATARGCLYAVYALLESVGWRFVVPGEDYFDAESFCGDGWRELRGETCAAFQWRGLSVVSPDVREIETVIEWMPKQRLNTLFIGHNGNVEQAATVRNLLVERDIRLETGGHILKDFLPIELFAQHPEYFRMVDGERRRDGNFCTSQPGALRVVADHAARYVDRLPGAEVFHFWAEDVEGGSWCQCPDCQKLPAYEQLMHATRAAADAIAQRRADATVDCLLYHDTLEVPSNGCAVRPGDNMFAFYGPRERCYAHGLDDPNCAKNVWYAQCLDKASSTFGTRLGVLEYYTSFMLWRNLGLSIPRTILADLRAYRAREISMVQTLHFGRITDWMCPLNVYTFARGMWDCTLDADQVTEDFIAARYGSSARKMQPVLELLQAASAHIIAYCGYDRDAYDLRDVPLAPADFAASHRQCVQEAIELTEQAVTQLRSIEHPAARADFCVQQLNMTNLIALLQQMRDEHESAIASLQSLHDTWLKLPLELIGSWRQETADQFMLIVDLLESAKRGQRTRTW